MSNRRGLYSPFRRCHYLLLSTTLLLPGTISPSFAVSISVNEVDLLVRSQAIRISYILSPTPLQLPLLRPKKPA
uniref:Putative secreted peptide n=1 Tax=Anopheles braziliensis TaxID=58242 RepID=A0A2M3ZW33_9DIPT